MNKRKTLLILSSVFGALSLAGILIPAATQAESTGFYFYKLSLIASITAIMAALALALVGRRLVDTILFLAMGLLGGYIILYVIIAHQERERATQLLACAIQLAYIQCEVVHYCEKTGKHPIHLADLALEKDMGKCPESGQEYVLWPKGIPDGSPTSPLPRVVIVAAEAEPRHMSPWFLPLFPYPYFLDHENERFCNSCPEITHQLVQNRKFVERERHSFFAMRCTGSLYVTGEGKIRFPGGGYTSILGLRFPQRNARK